MLNIYAMSEKELTDLFKKNKQEISLLCDDIREIEIDNARIETVLYLKVQMSQNKINKNKPEKPGEEDRKEDPS